MKRLLLSASPEDYWEQEPAVTIGELVLFPVLRPKGTLAMSLHSASFCGGQGLKQGLLSWCTDKFCCPPALAVRFGSCAAGHWGSPVQEELLGTSFLAHFSKAVGKGVWLCCSWDHLLACHCTWHKERLTRMLFLAYKETPPLVWRHFFKQSPLKWGGTREWLQHVWHPALTCLPLRWGDLVSQRTWFWVRALTRALPGWQWTAEHHPLRRMHVCGMKFHRGSQRKLSVGCGVGFKRLITLEQGCSAKDALFQAGKHPGLDKHMETVPISH